MAKDRLIAAAFAFTEALCGAKLRLGPRSCIASPTSWPRAQSGACGLN